MNRSTGIRLLTSRNWAVQGWNDHAARKWLTIYRCLGRTFELSARVYKDQLVLCDLRWFDLNRGDWRTVLHEFAASDEDSLLGEQFLTEVAQLAIEILDGD